MRQTELHLSSKDRRLVSEVRAKGLRPVREVNRAHILAALDRGVSESQIMGVLGVGRTVRISAIADTRFRLIADSVSA